MGPIDVMQIETLHHADKQKTEAYIIDLLSWLNYLVSRSKASPNGGGAIRPSIRSPVGSPSKEPNQQPVAKDTSESPTLSSANQELLEDVKCKSQGQGLSNTCDSLLKENNVEKFDDNELAQTEAHLSSNTLVHLGLGSEKSLDVIDRV